MEDGVGIALNVVAAQRRNRLDQQITHRPHDRVVGGPPVGGGRNLAGSSTTHADQVRVGDLRERALDPTPHLARRCAFLGHLVLQVRDDDRDAAFHHREDHVVFAGEVAVERLVRRAGLGDDVADPRRFRCHPFHHPNGGGKDALDLLGGLPLTFVECTLDGRGDPATGRRATGRPANRQGVTVFGADRLAADVEHLAGPLARSRPRRS